MTTPPEIETQMREAAIYCDGPAVPWMTARDIAERAVLAARSRASHETRRRAMHDTPPEIERLRAAAHRRPDDLVPVEEAEDAVWDVITRMNEEPAPCSGDAKRQARDDS